MNSNRGLFKIPKFLVVGHRGHGMNLLQSSDQRMKAYKENSIVSFNSAAKYPIDYIEFDVQVRLHITSHALYFLRFFNDSVSRLRRGDYRSEIQFFMILT